VFSLCFANNLPMYREEQLFVCHMNDHWFSLRKFGTQWINLNSFLPAPELISDMYHLLLLDTLKKDGKL